MASTAARGYNGGLGVEPPAGSRGRAPGGGIRGAKAPEAESLSAFRIQTFSGSVRIASFCLFCKVNKPGI